MLNKKILLIFLAAFLIRLIALNQSLWLDEAVTANVVKDYGFTQIINGFSPSDFHPPLYYLFMKLWTNVFGYSEIALRMPSVLFSLLTGYVVYLIGGIWAAVFFLFNPLIVYYSQEARMYMMTTFFLTVGLYYFIKSQKLEVKSQKFKLKFKSLLLMNLFFVLGFYTFYGSIFLIVTILLYLLFKKQYKIFFISCFLFLVSFVLISPLLYQQFLHSRIALNTVTNWSLVLGKANIKNLLLIPIKFSIGRISFYPKWLYWAVSGIWTGFVWFFVFRGGLKKQSIMIIMIITIITAFVFSFFTPLLQYFRFIYLIPIMSLLLGRSNLRGWILASGFLIFSLIYLLNPAFHREDWKSLVKNLPKNKPVYMITSSSDPIQYYSNNFKVNELTPNQNKAQFGAGELEQEIIVIPYTADIYGFDYKKSLNKSGYQQKEVKNFRELSFEIWRRR